MYELQKQERKTERQRKLKGANGLREPKRREKIQSITERSLSMILKGEQFWFLLCAAAREILMFISFATIHSGVFASENDVVSHHPDSPAKQGE